MSRPEVASALDSWAPSERTLSVVPEWMSAVSATRGLRCHQRVADRQRGRDLLERVGPSARPGRARSRW